MTLGICDSGLGGLTVLRRLRARLPHADLVYFADQRRVPYGDRSDSELRRLLDANLRYLEGLGVEAIVMGCNTSCAIASRYGWPDVAPVVFDLIESAAEQVFESGARRIGVLATAATARSGAYGNAIRSRCPGTVVTEVAAPALVPLIESGVTQGPPTLAAVAAACAPFASPLDALVLACTHFPLLDATFARVLGADVMRLDPAARQAERAARWAAARDPQNGGVRGRTRFITSGATAPFRLQLVRLGDLHELEDVEEQQHGEAGQGDAGDDLRGSVSFQVHP